MNRRNLSIFADSAAPAARSARARWGGGEPARWTPAPQRADGSWNGSVHDTIQELYAAWLSEPLEGSAREAAERGVNWLLECHHPPIRGHRNADGASYDNLFFEMEQRYEAARLRVMTGVPFGDGCSGFVKTGAALFLAQELGLGSRERVALAFESLEGIPAIRRGWWCNARCGSNIFQAYVLHPGPALGLALDFLARRESSNGGWGDGVPFYPTLNALARLDDRRAAEMFARALPRVQGSRAADGGWGRSDREFKTFLVLDAFERKGIGW